MNQQRRLRLSTEGSWRPHAYDHHVHEFMTEARKWLVHIPQQEPCDALPDRARWVNAWCASPWEMLSCPPGTVVTVCPDQRRPDDRYVLRLFWETGCLQLSVDPGAPPPPGGLSKMRSS